MTSDEAPTRIVVIRHGESRSTVERRIGGHRTCTGLSELGVRQVDALCERLAKTSELEPTALYSSIYPRARETAEALADIFELEVLVDADFGEHDPGPECDGLSFAEFVERHGTPNWVDDPHAVTFPGGETVADLHHRVGRSLSRVANDHRSGTIVIACHGGVIDAAFRTLLKLPMTGGFELHTVNTAITEFVSARSGRWRLVRYNDGAHLAGLPRETPRE